MTNSSINIILADDHEIFRDGFASLINKCTQINLVACAANGEELIRKTEVFLPDVILTDIIMPDMNGIEATRHLSHKFPAIGIIGFSMFNEAYLLKDMLDAGASGFLIKNAHKNEVIAAITAVNRGLPYFCADTAIKLSQLNSRQRFAGRTENAFTEREKEILLMICRGMTNKDIAMQMYLSVRTIEGYRERIMEKAGATNPASLVVFAIACDLITVDENREVRLLNEAPLVKARLNGKK